MVITDLSPNTISRQLVGNALCGCLCSSENCVMSLNGRNGDCMNSGRIYYVSCKTCGEEYIREPCRSHCVGIKERTDGKVKVRQSTPLGTHRTQKDNSDDLGVTIQILAPESKRSTRKSLEAFLINFRNPNMTQKGERLIVIRYLAPYFKMVF